MDRSHQKVFRGEVEFNKKLEETEGKKCIEGENN